MTIDRKAVLAGVGATVFAVVLALALKRQSSAPFEGAAAPSEIVALYYGRPTRPAAADSFGVRVADIGVDARGATLLSAGDPEFAEAVSKALAELSTRPFLPLPEEAAEVGGSAFTVNEAKPGDPRYAWAVGAFLRERTGLRYRVLPAAAR